MSQRSGDCTPVVEPSRGQVESESIDILHHKDEFQSNDVQAEALEEGLVVVGIHLFLSSKTHFFQATTVVIRQCEPCCHNFILTARDASFTAPNTCGDGLSNM